ncbi:UDP-N-acetylglucosamine 1-carboxyvinyltransferase [bacterium BMS3Abin07]|nr:UDP-N-acetylglucosamine 1-carboxyvinyltransferase [bacterium BMS3Abin07]GBE33134.1 UDP-N-acetylglucosamine 1-carboxyvinyltransferase [bacterium BMS3Bbin05]
MDKLIIKGGKKLEGTVKISGAKNAALPILAATILCPGKHLIRNVPDLRDVNTMKSLLQNLGSGVDVRDSVAVVESDGFKKHEAPYELVKTMRASVVILGPLLARLGKARVSLPGGCAIGARPINLHLMALEKMGAEISLDSGYVLGRVGRLKGTDIYLDIPTVTGTENILMAAVLAKGITRIDNAAMEPEVVDLANALISMGADIRGAGERVIEIKGVDELRPLDYTVIPDRIEAGTFMTAAAVTRGNILLENCRVDHLDAIMKKLEETGVQFEHAGNGVAVKMSSRPESRDIKTMHYPGFPTDMQAQFMALMSIAGGTSSIIETIFENRYMHVAELRRFGADIRVEGHTATVRGVGSLKGAPVMATDLRASASLVVAALCAEGESVIDRVYHIDRGYEGIEKKLTGLGADIMRIKG